MHISDLHLGNDIVLRGIIRRRPWWRTADGNVTNGLKQAIRELRPDYIVISGDLVNKASEATFNAAASYLRNLFLDAGFDLNRRVLIIPGNHDVSFFPKKHPDDIRRLRDYRKFLQVLFNESDLDSRRQRYSLLDAVGKVIIVCMDSTLKCQAPLAEGEIGNSQRDWLKTKMSKLSAQLGGAYRNFVKVAVMHHHCVAIAGTPPTSDRFMQLLDAGDVLKLLDELGFNIVLHGHKHWPHVTPHLRTDSSMLTVIGAGTTTCPYLEEQQTAGNNFYWIGIAPEENQLSVQLFKADGNGKFSATGSAELLPLFRIEPLGYSARMMKKTVTIAQDGTKAVTVLKEGLRVERPGKTISTFPLRVVSDAAEGEITNFDYDHTIGNVRFVAKSSNIIEGAFELKTPLIYGSSPVDLSYWYEIRNGTAMCKKDLARLYPSGTEKESTAAIVSNTIQSLRMELNFPRDFPAAPQVVIQHLGVPAPLPYNLQAHRELNRWDLEIANPPIDHRIILEWAVPDVWH